MKLYEISKAPNKAAVVEWLQSCRPDDIVRSKADPHNPRWKIDPDKIKYNPITGIVDVKENLALSFSHGGQTAPEQLPIYGKRDYSKLKTHSWEELEYEPGWNEVTHQVEIQTSAPWTADWKHGEFDPPFIFGHMDGQLHISGADKFNYPKLPKTIKDGTSGLVFYECKNVDPVAAIERCNTDFFIIVESTIVPGKLTDFLSYVKRPAGRCGIERVLNFSSEQNNVLEKSLEAFRNGEIDEFDFQDRLTNVGLAEYL
ncbi:hypothetical protein RsoM2USA_344 [Ralstonia phage RsoM2USA]|nr:hypothetical protein RsoM2USA_344 [Ralstonia phage RsoM2USA]